MRLALFSLSILVLLAACKSNTASQSSDKNADTSFGESSLPIEPSTPIEDTEEPISEYYQGEYFDVNRYVIDEKDIVNIPSDSIDFIEETYYVEVFRPEFKTFEDEESEEAEAYFTAMDDLNYYMYTARNRMEELGVESFVSKKRFLKFEVGDDTPIIIDIEKQGTTTLFLLYKKGKMPLIVDIVSSYDDDRIESYLEL